MRDDIYSSACRLIDALEGRHLTLACAESCTGGMIGAALTAVSGSSRVFLGGVISYAVDVKIRLLGVSEATVAECGVVSEQCAAEMARGAALAAGADMAVSVTGVAGPGGGSEKTPVGTVCFGVFAEGVAHAFTCRFDEGLGREGIREAAVLRALGAATEAADKLQLLN